MLKDNFLTLTLKNETLGENPKLLNQETNEIEEVLEPEVPLKFSKIKNHYNQLLLEFDGDYSIEFWAFDDGIAYRFITGKTGEIGVSSTNVLTIKMVRNGGWAAIIEAL